ncbi:MAG TPA: sensor domain-containing protein [Acidimicrobiales bacterium]|nr:sensor domain-containing protein [Acidimicrobiales bacterium]
MTLVTEDGESPAPPEHPQHKGVTLAITDEQVVKVKEFARLVFREPFTKRPWTELAFWIVSGALAAVSLAVVAATLIAGVWLIITFVGLIVIAFSLRIARGVGRWQRALALNFLGEEVEEPNAFVRRPGFFGWLQSALRDRVAWRSVAYLALKVPWTVLGAYVAFSLWWDAITGLLSPIFWHGNGGPGMWGLAQGIFLSNGYGDNNGFGHNVGVFLLGVIFFFAAPWVMRGFVTVDKVLIRTLLGPDPVAARVRSLEQARTTTVDASAATLRRIERDLHDGTQAQLVALAMRLGMAKEKLDDSEHVDLERVRELVDEAHRGAKEAITELRDIARGIHPPALDIGLEGALSTLSSRSAIPTELNFDVRARPTPAIEAIAYYCVAELLANVAQHAHASRATVSCAQQGTWLRLVVRDDGRGGAHLSTVGSTSSGLSGLTERVRAVDGRLDLVSPTGGPTVVTVDLPLSP